MKKNKKYLLPVMFSTVALSASIIASCAVANAEPSKASETPTDENQISMGTTPSKRDLAKFDVKQVTRSKLPDYNEEVRKNGLLVDAQEKAHAANNVLMYSINWIAVLHRYGALSHLIKVLELNPNKEVYIYTQGNSVTPLFSKIAELKDKYPNVNLRIIPQWNRWETFLFHHEIIEKDLDQLKDKNVDMYLDDYAILNTLQSYYKLVETNQSITEANNLILDNYLVLSKMHSINLIADGTASFRFYDDNNKDNYQGNFVKGMWMTANDFNDELTSFPLADEIREKLYSGTYSKSDLLNKSYYAGALLLQSYVTASKPLNASKTIPTKYFNAGTQTIIDMNSDNSGALLSVKGTQRFFDPYFSVNANIIELFNSYTDASKKLFEESLNITVQDRDAMMDNKMNIIYSGRNFDDNPSILSTETNRIITMYQTALKSSEREYK